MMFLRTIKILLVVLMVLPGGLYGQDQLNVIQGESSNNRWIQFSDAPNSLYHHIAGEAMEMLKERADRVSSLQTTNDWQQYQQETKEVLMEVLGPFPEKTDLNPRITRTIEKEGYRAEHIVFESRPEFYVTSTLFLPDDAVFPAPAVIYLSGHTQDGYRSPTYQHKMLNLVKKGFIVFAVDPVGQGERIEYYDPETGESIVGGPTREHSYAGVQAFIAGSSLASIMTWDGIRAVDYLLTRDEIDPERIGMTGRSGGGTQTAYIAAVDDRVYAAAPEAYITTFTRLLQSIGPQDAEQNLPHGIARGIDHADYLNVRAPNPTLLIATTEDFFSIQGARESAAEVSKMFEALGEPDHFRMVEDGGAHQSTRKNREAMYAFFQDHLDNPGSSEDLEVEILSNEEIRVTETGQVSTSLGGETVHSISQKLAEERITRLENSRVNNGDHNSEAIARAKELSGYRDPGTPGAPVFTGRINREDYTIEKYFTQGEGDYILPFLLFVPENSTEKSVLYLHPEGKSAEASENGEIEWFVRKGFTVLVPDLPGVGELGGSDMANYGAQVKQYDPVSYDVWPASVMIGRSITGIHAGDIVRLTRLLEDTFGADEILGVARKTMAPALLHAAAFEERISRVALLEPYISYRSVINHRYYDPGYHLSTVAGAAGEYDLADLAASLAPRNLIMAGVTEANGEWMRSPDATGELSVIETAYERENAGDRLNILSLNEFLLNWID